MRPLYMYQLCQVLALLAINPGKEGAEARNLQRQADISYILTQVSTYARREGIPYQINITENNFEHAFDNARQVITSYHDRNSTFVGVPVVTDSETFDAKRSQSLYVNLRSYGYIDSINSIYEGYWTFKMYDFILRTDIGKFLSNQIMYIIDNYYQNICYEIVIK